MPDTTASKISDDGKYIETPKEPDRQTKEDLLIKRAELQERINIISSLQDEIKKIDELLALFPKEDIKKEG